MAAAERRHRRCATYTRKSSEEGLKQDFNSLDAQREACEAYIRSQASEGWKPIRMRYDDGGCSGGTLDRPALRRVLADIEAGKIDTVVVYKVDRLTRSLADFAKIVEVMDAHGVSFVSVTQQFNTTTSMGRLTLNMLLSFAQFEREVTGERIRDKIAASKRRGLWMGGHVPLGYEPNGRTLAVIEAEAETVRTVFRLYLELGSVWRVKEEADRLRLRSKVRPEAGRKMRGGRPLSRGYIYHLLGNQLYVGRIVHKGESYEGQHPAIVDEETWDAVQRQLAEQGPPRPASTRARTPSPLRGKLFDEAGVALTPSHTVKGGRRYRYYIARDTRAAADGTAANAQASRWRLPAREIERLASDAVSALLCDPAKLTRLARDAGMKAGQLAELVGAASRWGGKPLEVVQRIELGSGQVDVRIDLGGVSDCAVGAEAMRLVIPVQMRRRGIESRLVITAAGDIRREDHGDSALIRTIARARQWFEAFSSGQFGSIVEIAKSEGVSDRYVGRLIPLAFLAPEIVKAIQAGSQPVDLTAEMLTKELELPLCWHAQKTALGFD